MPAGPACLWHVPTGQLMNTASYDFLPVDMRYPQAAPTA